jgi:hypothetical protein
MFRNLNSNTNKFRVLYLNFEDLSKFTSRIRRQKGLDWTRAKTPKPLLDLKKKRRPAVFPFKVAGSWPKRAGWRPQSASHSGFLADYFPQGAVLLPNLFAPAFIWREAVISYQLKQQF